MTRVAVVRFPGSNCDVDALRAVQASGADATIVWHREVDLGSVDAVILPGGFAYGDHLRAGAIARFSPIMEGVIEFAESGGAVLGICNGFQMLCEAGLLPGALMRNAGQRFVSRPVATRIESTQTPFTTAFQEGDILDVPVAHGEGRYVAPPEVLEQAETGHRIVLRYVRENPNGSMHDIAGITNATGNVVGMMPHPERVADPAIGDAAGAKVFESVALGVGLYSGGSQ